MGYYYQAVGQLDKAQSVYEVKRALLEQLLKTDSQNLDLINGLAITLSWLGEIHAALGKLDKALQFYKERSRLGKELYESYPINACFKYGLAISYQNLGNTYAALGHLDPGHLDLEHLKQALQFYQDYNALVKELYESYPMEVSFKDSLAIWVLILIDVYIDYTVLKYFSPMTK